MNQERYKETEWLERVLAIIIIIICSALFGLLLESILAECEIINYHLDENWQVTHTSCKDLKHVWEG